MRWTARGLVFILFGLTTRVNGLFAQDGATPVADFATVKVGGITYVMGEVFLSSAEDTVALKQAGFGHFEFAGRAVHGVKYSTMWPLALSAESLARITNGWEYSVRVAEEPDQPLDVEEAIQASLDRSEAVDSPFPDERVYRRFVVGDLAGGRNLYGISASEMVPRNADEDVPLTMQGYVPATPAERLRHELELLYSKNNPLMQRIHALQMEAWSYELSKLSGSGYPRAFEMNEPGPYYPPASPPSGTRAGISSSPGAGSLRPNDFGILKTYSTFQTGHTQFPIRPSTMSAQEWRKTR